VALINDIKSTPFQSQLFLPPQPYTQTEGMHGQEGTTRGQKKNPKPALLLGRNWTDWSFFSFCRRATREKRVWSQFKLET